MDTSGLNPRVNYIPPEMVEQMWDDILPRLDIRALGALTSEALYNGLMSGRDHLWALHDDEGIQILVVTTVVPQPTRTLLWVQYASGQNMERFLPLAKDTFQVVGLRLGCDHVMITGRRGFLAALKSVGFVEESVNMVAPLKGTEH